MGSVKVRLDTVLEMFEILAQPVVAKANTGIGSRVRLGLLDEGFEGGKFVDQLGQRFPFDVGIG